MLMVTLDFVVIFTDYCRVLTALLLKFRGVHLQLLQVFSSDVLGFKDILADLGMNSPEKYIYSKSCT